MSPTKKEALEMSYLCHHWGKYHIKDTGFSLESAHQLLVSLQGKKADQSIKSKLNCYKTTFKLMKKGGLVTRSQKIPYLSIIRFFVFKTEPHLIFLGVEKRKRLSYIVLLFRDIKEVNEVCDIIERNRSGIVREGQPHIVESEIVVCQEKPIESEKCVIVCTENRYTEESKPVQVTTETQSEPLETTVVYVNNEEQYKVPVVKSHVEFHHDMRHTDDMGTTTVEALLVRTNRNNVDSKQWEEDMKYLEYNPVKGTATESEEGPIYMYTAHFTPADYNNIGSCESDDDSSSNDSMSSSDHQGMVMKKNGRTVVMAHRASDAAF